VAHNPRHQRIVALLQSLRTLTVSDLAVRLGVSEVTIRKDLTVLEERGVVQRSHGGATLAQDAEPMASVAQRSGERQEGKRRIAEAALAMVSEGDVVALDAGSTTLALARLLARRPVRVVTNSLPVAQVLAGDSDATLTMIGGTYRAEAGSFIGPIAEEAIAGLRVDVAFIGATAFTAGGAFYCQNATEGQTKHRFLEAARRRVIVADAAKFDARAFARFARPGVVDLLITDAPFPGIDAVRDAGIEVVVATGTTATPSATSERSMS